MYQAERKLRTSTHIPDLDNANVGTYKEKDYGRYLGVSPFYIAETKQEAEIYKRQKPLL